MQKQNLMEIAAHNVDRALGSLASALFDMKRARDFLNVAVPGWQQAAGRPDDWLDVTIAKVLAHNLEFFLLDGIEYHDYIGFMHYPDDVKQQELRVKELFVEVSAFFQEPYFKGPGHE